MKNLKENKPLQFALGALLLVLLCYNLPNLLFFPLCIKEDIFRPPNTEVLVSACKKPGATGTFSGEALFVSEGYTGNIYRLDLITGEKSEIPKYSLLYDYGVFLSPKLVWIKGSLVGPGEIGYQPHYILDLTDGHRFELLDLNRLPQLENYKFDPKYYAYFQSAEKVFIHQSENILIALSPDFRQHPEKNVIFSQYVLSQGESIQKGELLEQLMKNLGVDYQIVDLSLNYADIPSPKGRYVARSGGIYLFETNAPIITRKLKWYFKGWYYDESGIVLQEAGYYLIDLGPDFGGGFYYIPSPILKLRLPES